MANREAEPSGNQIFRKTRASGRQIVVVVLAAHACALLVGLGFRAVGASEANTVLVFLVAVAAVAFLVGRTASFAAALLAVLSFNFFFTHPTLTMAVEDLEYLFTFAVLLVTGLMVSTLVGRLRDEAARASEQADVNRVLYRVGSQIASTVDATGIAERACAEILHARGTEAVVFLANGIGVGAVELAQSPIERTAAESALQRAGEAGRGTAYFTDARAFHVVLPSSEDRPLGTLGVVPRESPQAPSERRLVHGLAAQVALALARERLAAEAQRIAVEAETERLRANLLASVSHDLRTPLAAIAGGASTMLELEGVMRAEERKELCSQILAESVGLARTVDNLLQLGRLEDGRVRMTRDWFPIEELVEAALARLSRVGDTARVRVELPTEPPVVLVDAHLMVNLMINLLDNALRYAPHGPIVVAVEVIADKVSMTVRDEGPGLPDGEPDELFDRFFRGKNTRRIRGSGLGLSICRATAHAHGGTLTARPGLDGRGSAFRLLLPLDDDADAGRLNAPLVEEEA